MGSNPILVEKRDSSVGRAAASTVVQPLGPCAIELTQGKIALVDEVDYARIALYRWHAFFNRNAKSWYAGRGEWIPEKQNNKIILMHREILGIVDSKIQVDHRNHDGLDNRRDNLRTATNGQNQANKRKQSNCSSRFKGVTLRKRTKKWDAQICANGKMKTLGSFDSEEAAARCYDAAARERSGEFALTNF